MKYFAGAAGRNVYIRLTYCLAQICTVFVDGLAGSGWQPGETIGSEILAEYIQSMH